MDVANVGNIYILFTIIVLFGINISLEIYYKDKD